MDIGAQKKIGIYTKIPVESVASTGFIGESTTCAMSEKFGSIS